MNASTDFGFKKVPAYEESCDSIKGTYLTLTARQTSLTEHCNPYAYCLPTQLANKLVPAITDRPPRDVNNISWRVVQTLGLA